MLCKLSACKTHFLFPWLIYCLMFSCCPTDVVSDVNIMLYWFFWCFLFPYVLRYLQIPPFCHFTWLWCHGILWCCQKSFSNAWFSCLFLILLLLTDHEINNWLIIASLLSTVTLICADQFQSVLLSELFLLAYLWQKCSISMQKWINKFFSL